MLFFATIILSISHICAQHSTVSGAIKVRNQEPGVSNNLRVSGIQFTQNKGQLIDMEGQLRPDILYKGNSAGVDVFLRRTGVSYVYTNIGEVTHIIEEQVEEVERSGKVDEQGREGLKEELMKGTKFKGHRIDMDFAGCNSNVIVTSEDEVQGYNNYYFTHCPQGVLNVKQYNKVTYKNIYNDIDAVYYGNREGGLKYDIIINQYADPSHVKLQWKGAENIYVNREGNLVIKTSVNEFFESIPKVYQNINGKIVDVKARYVLNETTINFELGTWNPKHPLVIDPWASYYGGSSNDETRSVTTDPIGNVLFTGSTQSVDFPVLGAFQGALAGGYDAFVVKMNSAGIRIFATHFGSGCGGIAIATDAIGNICVAGEVGPTGSIAGFSGANVVHQNLNGGGGGDAFLAKFDPAGSRLWSTFYGGTGDDRGWDVCTDGSNVYLYGRTNSPNSIATAGTFQSVINGPFQFDAFVVKFAPNGSRTWATYVGGTANEFPLGIACDIPSGNIYFTGGTSSTDFPVTAGAHQISTGASTNDDAFLFKLNPAGTQLWATYYGGTGSDGGSAICTDNLGNVIIGGNTSSVNAIATIGAYQVTKGTGTFDCFIAKFNSNGVRQWGTYLGGSEYEILFGVAADNNNNIYVLGEWEDNGPGDYTVSACAIQPVFGGGPVGMLEDQFIAKYDASGWQRCITYMGGTGEDDMDGSRAGGIAVYGNTLYIVGWTDGGYPVTAGAYQTVFKGVRDGFINQLCINLCEAKVLSPEFIANSTNVCTNVPVTYTPSVSNVCDTSGYKFQWTFTGGTPSGSNLVNPVVTYPAPGNYNVQLTVATLCKNISVNKTGYITVNSCNCTLSAQVAAAANVTGCNGANNGSALVMISNGTGPYSYSWSNGTSGITGTTSATTIPFSGLPAATYTITIIDGTCISISTVTITQPAAITLTTSATLSGSACGISNGSASVSASGGSGSGSFTFTWSNGGTGQTINSLAVGSYTVTVRDSNGCTKTTTVNVNASNPLSATFTFSPACVGTVVNFVNTGTSGSGVTYNWSAGAPVNVSGTSANFSNTFLTAGTYGVTHTVTKGGCSAILTRNIQIVDCSAPTVTATGNSVCPGLCATVTSSGIGGAAPYTYSWSTGATTQNISPCPGSTTTYTVKITDTNGATSTSAAVVTINPVVTVTTTPINITCNGSTNGSITATGGSGTSPYVYNWSNGQAVQTTTGLTAGNYSVTITDSKGCSAISTAAIISPSAIVGQFAKGTAVCSGCGCKQWIMLTASGGTSPYSYSWPDGYVNRYKNQVCPGNYTVNIKDKNGCSINVNLSTP